MERAPPPILDREPGAPWRRVLLVVAVLLPVLAALAPRDLWAPDEPRFGLVARTMLDEGHWLVPRINGEVYAEKPPLVPWTMAATGAVFGMGPRTARWPCALLAALAVLSTFRLARRWWGDLDLAVTAALLFSTTGLVLWNASRAALDLPMTAFGLLALEAGTAVAVRGSSRAALAMGGALGLGLLTKGPHALYVPLTALVGGCLAAGRPRRILEPRWLLALLVAVGVFAAWLVPALAVGGHLPAYNSGDTFRERLLGQIARRVGGENEPHEAPFWYLLVLVLPFALPWTPLWVAGLAQRGRRRAAPLEERFGLGAVTAGLLVPLLLLSVPSSKRELYLLPLLPCASLLAAWVLHRAADSGAVRHAVRSVVGLFAGLAVGAFLTPILAGTTLLPVREVDRPALASLTQGIVPFAFGGVGALLLVGAVAAFLARARPVVAARAAGLSLGAAWLVIVLAVLPAFDRWKSFEGARAAGEAAAPGAPLASAGFADASILWGFHRDRLLQLGLRGEAEAARLLAPAAPTALLLAKEKHWTNLLTRAAPADADLLRRARPVWRDAVGGVVYVLLTNAAP